MEDDEEEEDEMYDPAEPTDDEVCFHSSYL